MRTSIAGDAKFVFSPDKRQLLYTGVGPDCCKGCECVEPEYQGNGAYRFDLKDKTLTRVTPEYFSARDILIAPSGDEIMYLGSCGGKAGSWGRLCKVPLSGGTPTLLVKDVYSYSFAAR